MRPSPDESHSPNTNGWQDEHSAGWTFEVSNTAVELLSAPRWRRPTAVSAQRDERVLGRIELGRVFAVPATARCRLRSNWTRNLLAPSLVSREESRSLERPSDLEPVSGFEPLTVRLQGQRR
jgi:hypothetical protein